MNYRRALDIGCSVILPLLVGGSIYYLTRPHSIYFLFWLDAVFGRFETDPNQWPIWIVYQLPCALWTFSATSLVSIVWQRILTRGSALFISTPFLFAVFLEVFTGVFDRMDLLALVLGYSLSLVICFLITRSKGSNKALETSSMAAKRMYSVIVILVFAVFALAAYNRL